MPCASRAERAVRGSVAVAADDGGAGSVKPCFGPMTCTMPDACRIPL